MQLVRVHYTTAPDTKTVTQTLKNYCDQHSIPYVTEKGNKAGRTDFETSIGLIEIKPVAQWKQAIGQLLVYHQSNPRKKLGLLLFCPNGNPISKAQRDLIFDTCRRTQPSIVVTFFSKKSVYYAASVLHKYCRL